MRCCIRLSGLKRKAVSNHYNQLSVDFRNHFGLDFRVFDDGIAYRFRTSMPDSITVIGEEATFVPANPDTALFPRLTGEQNAEKVPGRFYTSFEERYERRPVFSIRGNEMAYVPVLIYSSIRPDILITEADIRDYPGMFLCGSDDGSGRLNGCFAPYPLDTRTTGYYPQDQVTKTASYIAHTIGSRTFPWRIASVAGCDARWLE